MPTVGDLQKMNFRQLDVLFNSLGPGTIPDGKGTGTALIVPGTPLEKPLEAFIKAHIWEGKIFQKIDDSHGTLINVLGGGQEDFKAEVKFGKSRLSPFKKCIKLDYSENDNFVKFILDEIRLIDTDFYLGRVYLGPVAIAHFCLQFNTKKQRKKTR